jgi:mandelate racemase
MAEPGLVIRKIKARAVNAPMARPVKTAVGSISSAPLVLIDVLTEEGIEGRSYIFAYTGMALRPLVQLIEELAEELSGTPVAPVEQLRAFDRRFRLLGWQGLVGMAVSGLDMALWDVMGRAVSWPVARLLGGSPRALSAYDSYGVVDPIKDEPVILRSLERGFRGIKIKVGDGDLARDEATVRAVRAMIGPDVALMVDYNQSLDPIEAIRRISRLSAYDLHWVEEPVRAEDLRGHAHVRAASPAPIQTGENWWFPSGMAEAIAAGACDYAMPDLMKIGGITGWTRAMAQAEAASVPMSSHIFVEASAHALAAAPTAHWIEYLDLAGELLAEPCQLRPDGTIIATGPGLGLTWNEAAVARFSV